MKKKISTGGKIFIAAGLILIAAAVQYILFNIVGIGGERSLVMTDTGTNITYGLGTDAQFYSYDSENFYYCTKNGMQYVSSKGEPQWNVTYSLSNPDMAAAGEMVAVGDARGRHIYVFDSVGAAYDVALDYPVLTFSVNRTGTLSAILQLDKGYAVHIYNRRNYAAPVARYVFQDELMLPVSSSVSEDGRVAVIAFWNLDIGYSSRVSFYFTNETDAWATEDGMFASQDSTDPEDQFVHTVRFVEGNRALVFSDAKITCFQLDEGNTCTQAWSVPLRNEVDLLDFYGGTRFAVALGDKFLNDEEASEPGTVNIYNNEGVLTGTFQLGRKATALSMGHNAVLVGADRGFYALGYAGDVLWSYRAIMDVKEMLFLDDANTVLLAGHSEASVWRRERERPSPPPEGDGLIPAGEFPSDEREIPPPVADEPLQEENALPTEGSEGAESSTEGAEASPETENEIPPPVID